MNCANTTGLITNGSGGYLNAFNRGTGNMNFINVGNGNEMAAINTPNVIGMDSAVNQWGAPINAPSNVVAGGAGVSVSDINAASGSYMDPSGQTPVYGNPNLPAVSEDLCNAIKCGAQSADDATKFACSKSFGAGVWDLCGDARCLPYRNASCGGATPPTSASLNPMQPLTPASLMTPIPNISGGNLSAQLNSAYGDVGPGVMCSASQWVNNNPLLAVAVLGGLFLLLKGTK